MYRITILYHFFIITALLFLFSERLLIAQSKLKQENYDVKFYGLDISINDTSTHIEGFVQIKIEIVAPADTLVFNLGGQLNVSKLIIGQAETSFIHKGDILTVFPQGLQTGQIISVYIYYKGDGNHAGAYGALFNRSNSYGRFTYSITEPFASKYWFPCKEVLSDKADSVHVHITVAENLKAGSNGLLTGIEPVSPGVVKYKWQSVYPVSYYLISVAVGNYLDYTFQSTLYDTLPPLPVVNYIYNSKTYFNNAKSSIDATGELLKLFSGLYGVYPFYKEKYGHCLVPIGGGMEHQTMTTIGDFGFELVAHELAHQWFGNFVTCKYWNDIWINEGFASYSEYIALENLKGTDAAKNWMNSAHDYVMLTNNGSVYVPEEDISDEDRIFDYGLSYKKGAAIIHMLRYELDNDSIFFSILKEFLKRYSFNTATGNDFKLVLEEMSGVNFDNFFNEWYYGQGYPIMDVSWFQLNDTLYITNYQTTSSPETTSFFHLKVQYRLITPTGDTLLELRQTKTEEIFKIFMPRGVVDIKVDPENYLIKQLMQVEPLDSGKILSGKFIFFPNPAKESITIFSRALATPFDAKIFDQNGIEVASYKNINPNGSSFSIARLIDGLYYLQIEYNGSIDTLKFIKQ